MSLGKVLVTAKSVAGCEAAIRSMAHAGCDVAIETTPQPFDEDWLIEHSRDAAALVVAMEPVSRRLIDASHRLKIIARPGVGCDTVDVAAATRRGVAVTIAAGTNDQSVADFTMGLLLMSARLLMDGALSVQHHGWDRPVGTELWRKTLAVVGLGRIGQGVARRALGFDMRVLAVMRRPEGASAALPGVACADLETALREADFVSLHLPLTAQTENLIDARTLASMKKGAYLVNTSRGGLVDEAALADAVRTGHLAGAAVDVLRVQGVDSPSPLIGVPGIIVTPHMASLSREATRRVAESVAASVIAALSGQRPSVLVNPEVFAAPRTEA